MKINLHIDHVLVDGLQTQPGSASKLKIAIEREVVRHLTERGLHPDLLQGAFVSAIPALPVVIAADEPVIVGTRVGQAVSRAICNPQQKGGQL